MLRSTRWKWLLVAFIFVVAVALGVLGSYPGPKATLRDLKDVEELRAQFNRDKGMPRIILLLSPT